MNLEILKPGRIQECLSDFLGFYLNVSNFCFLSYGDEVAESQMYDFSENEFQIVQINEVFSNLNSFSHF